MICCSSSTAPRVSGSSFSNRLPSRQGATTIAAADVMPAAAEAHQRKGWDLNPRRLAPRTLSRRVPLAARAPFRIELYRVAASTPRRNDAAWAGQLGSEHAQRRAAKNSVSRAAASVARTPWVTGGLWFSRGSAHTLYRLRRRPGLEVGGAEHQPADPGVRSAHRRTSRTARASRTSVQSSSRQSRRRAPASRMASTSAWAVGSGVARARCARRAMTSPSARRPRRPARRRGRRQLAPGRAQRIASSIMAPRLRRSWRREWDSNPRRVAPHTLSKRADSAALASLLTPGTDYGPAAWPGEVTGPIGSDRHLRHPPGEVTVGSCATGGRESGQDREAAAFNGMLVCRRSPGRHLSRRVSLRRRRGRVRRTPCGRWHARAAAAPALRSARRSRRSSACGPRPPPVVDLADRHSSTTVAISRNSIASSSCSRQRLGELLGTPQARQAPLPRIGRDGVDRAELARARWRRSSLPNPAARDTRRRCRRRARGSRRSTPGRRRTSPTRPARRGSRSSAGRAARPACPARTGARSLSGVTISTCSTRSSRRRQRAAAASASSASCSTIAHVVTPILIERGLDHGDLREQLGRHPLARLVAGPQIVAEALDHVIGRRRPRAWRLRRSAAASMRARRPSPRTGPGRRGASTWPKCCRNSSYVPSMRWTSIAGTLCARMTPSDLTAAHRFLIVGTSDRRAVDLR